MPRAKTPRNNASTKQAAPAPQMSAMPRVAEDVFSVSSTVELEAQIRQRAYELYQERGCTPGQENDDWFRAEREVLSRNNHHSV